MKHALQYMQLCPVDISPINTREKFMLLKVEPLTLKSSEIKSQTLKEKGFLNIYIKLGQIQQEKAFWLMIHL